MSERPRKLVVAALRQVPEVKSVRLTLERQALVTANGQTRGAVLRGVRADDLLSRDIVTGNIVQGELGAFDTRPGVVIGERLRQGLGLRAGDKLTVVTHRLNESGTIAPRYADYEVLASFLSRRFEFDNGLIFMPLQMLQQLCSFHVPTVTISRTASAAAAFNASSRRSSRTSSMAAARSLFASSGVRP